MARVRVKPQVRPEWVDTDELAVRQPAGGGDAISQAVSALAGVAGFEATASIEAAALEFTVDLPGGCGVFDYDVVVRDVAGNTSTAFASFDRVSDAPRGVARPTLAGTGNTGEALLTATPSADVMEHPSFG
ncbi:MAG: hypothetical protein AAF797_07015 [Planctomycetota bacterium]